MGTFGAWGIGKASIKVKLWVLAGVPVVGALFLASMIVGDSRQQSAKAAAIGSIEDLAQLSGTMADAMHALQAERASTALAEGLEVRPLSTIEAQRAGRRFDRTAALERATGRMRATRSATDESLRQLDSFLASRDISKLPPRLARDLAEARARLGGLGALRARADAEVVHLDDVLELFNAVDTSLVRAIAGLSELTDDGQLLRNIASLVAVLELAERASRQHALLANTFASTQFAPGAFKTFVTLMTEEQIYRDIFTTNASDAERGLYEASLADARVKKADEMRRTALESTDESLEIDFDAWSQAQQGRIDQLVTIEHEAMNGMRRAAASKALATQGTVRNGIVLSVMVLAISVGLALLILRGITRSVGDLGRAASRVRETRDYSTRAHKTTDDELGLLTDTFNEMLAGIETRDEELEHHRKNLEALVAERTGELEERSKAMRMVLDNVEQALVTVRRDGTMELECSAAFERLFGSPAEDEHFADRIAGHDQDARTILRLSWEAANDDFLPLDLVLDQIPKRSFRYGRHLTMNLKPIDVGGRFGGALLVISDVTAAVEASREQERQREYVKVFERAMHDRLGMVEFVTETGKLVDAVAGREITGLAEVRRAIHTVKGNAATWDVTSVASAAHDLESLIEDKCALPSDAEVDALRVAWNGFSSRVADLLQSAGSATYLEISRDEIESLLVKVRQRGEHGDLERAIDRLRQEPVQMRFERMKDQFELLARKLGKPKPRVIIDAGDVRLPAARFAALWQALVHLVRNAMDHGIESPEAREAAGKSPSGTLTLRSRASATELSIEVGDDGAGIDWERVREKAAAAGLPAKTEEDLESALFSPGLSTAERVTELSGRGVGLGAVREECQRLGGRIEIVARPGKGTTFRVRFPRSGSVASIRPVFASPGA